MTKRAGAIAFVLMVTCGLHLWAQAPQTMPANDLHKVRNMLREGYEAVKKDYYDVAFHGLDLDARFKEYDEKLKTFKDTPRKDWATHAADAFRYLAMAYRQEYPEEPPPRKPGDMSVGDINEMTLDYAWASAPQRDRERV